MLSKLEISSQLVAGRELRSFKSPLTSKEVYYQKLGCWYNAAYNQNNAYAGLNLEFKVGSVIYDDPVNQKMGGWGWVMVGNRYCHPQGLKDWKGVLANSSSDIHCWLQDKEGNIYDWNTMKDVPFEKLSPAKLKKQGITYKATTGDVEKYLYEMATIGLKKETFRIFNKKGTPFKEAIEFLHSESSIYMKMVQVVLEDWMGDDFFELSEEEQKTKLSTLCSSVGIDFTSVAKQKYQLKYKTTNV